MDELSEEDKIIVNRAKRIQKFLNTTTIYCRICHWIARTICTNRKNGRDFEKIINGDCDHLPEQAFYMVGTLEEV